MRMTMILNSVINIIHLYTFVNFKKLLKLNSISFIKNSCKELLHYFQICSSFRVHLNIKLKHEIEQLLSFKLYFYEIT